MLLCPPRSVDYCVGAKLLRIKTRAQMAEKNGDKLFFSPNHKQNPEKPLFVFHHTTSELWG